MPLFAPIVPTRYVLPLLALLRPLGQRRIDAALGSLGLSEAALRAPHTCIDATQYDAMLTLFADLSGRTDLGFELGQVIKLADHLTLGEALLRCATLDQMLRLLTRFSRLVTPIFSLTYRRDGASAELIWQPAAFMSAATLRLLEELFAVSVHMELQAALGERLAGVDIHLSMTAPPHAWRYQRLRPTRYHFSAASLPQVRCVFDATLLDTPLQPSTAPLTSGMLESLRRQQQGIARTRQWAQWVRVILREAEGCQPGRDALAKLLNVSPTSLTRQLAAEGCTLRGLGNEVRHQRACQMLRDGSQPITEIAYRLGYRDSANFSHAFRRIAGMSPQAYRNAALHARHALPASPRH